MESTQTNPYQAPEAELSANTQSEPNQSGVLSISGRIGRLRYLAYQVCVNFALMFIIGIIAAIAIPALGEDAAGGAAAVIAILIYLPMIFFSWVFMIRRLNDIGWSGWTSLLFLIPVVNIILGLIIVFKKGDAGANKYGAQPRPNGAGVYIASIAAIFFFVAYIGVMAAIALPAYNDYLERAKIAQQK